MYKLLSEFDRPDCIGLIVKRMDNRDPCRGLIVPDSTGEHVLWEDKELSVLTADGETTEHGQPLCVLGRLDQEHMEVFKRGWRRAYPPSVKGHRLPQLTMMLRDGAAGWESVE